MATFYITPKDEDLQHYGILGMKWGVRRYQNEDGSLTSAGRRRYQNEETALTKARKTSRGYAMGNILLGPVGGIAGAIKGFNTKESDINKSHLEKDMMTLQKDRLYDAEKKKQRNITPEGKNARRLYEAVNPNATPEQTRNALSKAFQDAKTSKNIDKALAIATIIGFSAFEIGSIYYEDYKKEKEWSDFLKKYDKNIDYGKVYTDTELKEFKNIDINKIKSAGGDF